MLLNCTQYVNMVGVIGTNWNQIKRELITMWQIVNQVRKETPVTV
jgi:hypothetical protein